MLLKVENLTVHYGKAIALDHVSLELNEGSIVSIVGANGAGKSTILRAISGLKPITSGNIWFNGMKMDGMQIHEIVKLGVVQIPEGRKLFPYLTVLSNLRLGASLRQDKAGINKDLDDLFKRFPILWERRNQKAGTLSGGEQQMLAIGRGLMGKPKLLLMDEPSVGLAPIIVEKVGDVIKEINQGGVSILLVEQNVPLTLRVANTGYILQVGRVVLEGDMDKLKSSETLKRAYLGG
jgi:branched-chain amino acid transport system ATP-binding protein